MHKIDRGELYGWNLEDIEKSFSHHRIYVLLSLFAMVICLAWTAWMFGNRSKIAPGAVKVEAQSEEYKENTYRHKIIGYNYKLMRKRGTKEELIFRSDVNGEHQIVRWNEYLVFDQTDKNNTTIILHNMTNGATKQLYIEKNPKLRLVELVVANGNLRFSFGNQSDGITRWELIKPDSELKVLEGKIMDFDTPTPTPIISLERLETPGIYYLVRTPVYR
jgi:hypothetical protein